MTVLRTVIAGLAAAVCLVASTALVVGVGEGADGPPPAGTLDLDGSAVLMADGTRTTLQTGRHRLSTGDRVQLVRGSGVLALGGDASLELREGHADAIDTEVEVADPAVLRAGDALLVAPTAARVVVGGTEFGLAGGAARFARATGSSVAVYEGFAALSSGGRSLPGGVPALRQATVTTLGAVPTRPEPLDYDPVAPDPWDLRFLGAAIELGEALEARSTGFTAALADDQEIGAEFLAGALPGLGDEPSFTDSLLDDGRSAGELLVGAAIAQAGRQGKFLERWRSVFSFRAEGAHWGLVALDQGVVDVPLLAMVDAAVDGSPLLFSPEALALAGESDFGGDRGGGGVDGVGGLTPPPSPAPPDGPPPDDPPPDDGGMPPVTPPPALDPILDPLDPILDPLDPAVDPVLETVEPALEPLEPVVQPLQPLLDPVEELLGGVLGEATPEEPGDAGLVDGIISLLD